LLEDKLYQDQVSLMVMTSEEFNELSLKKHPTHIEVNMFLANSSSVSKS